MISLNELICLNVEEVLATPLLRQAVISYVKNLFYGGSPVTGCDSSVRIYFRRLQLDGLSQQKKLSEMKYQLKPGIVIQYMGEVYNSSTMTDSIAEAYLAKFPKAEKHFNILPDAPAEESVNEPAAPKKTRKKK